MKCTHCAAEYSSETFAQLELAKKNGGRMTYGTETHEYRVCACGCHVLQTTRASVRPATSGATPSVIPIPMYAEASDGRRR